MRRSRPTIYSVALSEEIAVNDKLHTYKRWFNGMKHFFTVKVIPPYNREGLE